MFVQRNEEGEITGVFESEQPGVAEELIDGGDEDLIYFYERLSNEQS